ncbi:hypothetical protein ACQ4PT_026564 [Festuca glaucescens]
MLDYTGKLKFLSWNNHSSSWEIISERPAAACDLYASCGPFSYCDFTRIIPACQCLGGFEPVDGTDFSKGCWRKKELKCGKQSHFVALPGMMVPDKFLHLQNRSFDECVAYCSRNCSCMAYAYANLSGVGALEKSNDRLTHAKPLSASDTLISEGGVFALGFLSLTSSNTTLYLCIWYHNISERTVVWTANRDNPVVATSSPILTFTNSSDLVLSDSQGRTPWVVKSNITGMGVAAVLLDTGNFVLQFPNSTVIWQSFDHPTDTLLPNMKLFLSVGRLLAWKGLNDPSSGNFSLSFNASWNLQLVIWHGTQPYSRIFMLNDGPVFGDTFQNIIFFEAISGTGNGSFYTYHLSDGSPYARVTLDYLGVLSTLRWNHSSWTTISKRPASICDLYASCGPFGYCNNVGDAPTCQCLDGFEPAGPGMNSSAGCRRTEALVCSKKSRFVNLTQIKIPDKFQSLPNKSIDECASECSSNCLCTAYAYANSSSNDALVDPSSCLVWAGELIDTGKNSGNGEILHLRLADFPACQCLDGFEPVDGINFSKGCHRQQAIECGKQSHFTPLSGMKVPNKFLHIRNISLDECVAECSRNCSCTAYAYTNLSSAGAMADPSRCLVWSGELIDVAKPTSRENMYIRLADSPVNKKSSTVQIVLPIISFLLLLTCIAIGMYKYKGKWRKKKNQKKLMLGYFSTSKELEGNSTEFPSVTFEDILSATNFFGDSNLLGRGGFGKVYKGTFEGGNEVAVKRLSPNSGQGTVEFRNEVVLIAKLQHKNLVRLLGCCIHGDEKLLIYEYLPNKSLDSYLFDGARKHELDWLTRFKIIKGIARGILYLHQDSRLTIIHRDLKASNILLDKEMTPKISDFGMARIFGANQNQANTNRVVGTYGYMSPEYAMRGAFSVKSDTYSFGVLLLEIISGLKISSPLLIANFSSLITYAWRLWEDEKTTELVDSSVVASCPLHEVLRCIHVGLLCVQDHPNDRPLMSSVMYMIENQNALLPTPKQPIYFAESNYEGGEARESMENSVNAMSITTHEGR